MRECWINVYVSNSGRHVMGVPRAELSSVLAAADCIRSAGAAGPSYRLHVRLKPEAQIRIEHGIFI